MKRTIKNAFAVIVLMCHVVVIASCDQGEDKESLGGEIPRIILEKFSLTETRQGEKVWVLQAFHARVFDDLIHVDSVEVRFFNKAGEEFSLMQAPGGILNTRTHNVLVGDSVEVVTNDSIRLYTDSLFWMNDSELIITNRPVTIIKADSTIIQGTGLRADPYLEKIEILGTAQGISPIKLPDINR
ncbi:LPS export ABC transporter periplasmic protein LptC [candidate division WOR-3 bacterium]|nr:LPS export ABC transporter periplasmic protein LptC [candidate division WOR-3 bacterium]